MGGITVGWRFDDVIGSHRPGVETLYLFRVPPCGTPPVWRPPLALASVGRAQLGLLLHYTAAQEESPGRQRRFVPRRDVGGYNYLLDPPYSFGYN